MNVRIKALQKELINNKLDAYYLNTTDYHMSEYVPFYFKTIEYFTGFTGSLASLIIDTNNAYLFVDGRYHIQAEKQCYEGIKVMRLGEKGVPEALDYLIQNYKNVGLDGKRTSIDFVLKLLKAHINIRSIDIYSKLINDRVPLNNDKLYKFNLEYAGKSRKEKIDDIKYCLDGKCHIINNLESIAYILNLRGNDILYTPVFLAYLIFYKNDLYFFIDLERLNEDIINELYEDGVIIKPYDYYYEFLKTIKNEIIILDDKKVNYESYLNLRNNNNQFSFSISIVEELKAMKNDIEIKNTRLAHIYDGVAMVRFLYWLNNQDKEQLNEYDILLKLNEIRLNYKAFDLSFKPIIAYNENAAMMHYSPTVDHNKQLKNEGILLIDSGGHYLNGTTDITRTIALGEVNNDIKKHFTLVLKSMFNLSEVIFLSGMAGKQLDILARKDLWEIGIDYRCGTGHGVGHVLAVHEGPPNIRFKETINKTEDMPLKIGHIVSDEPGVYLENKYGLRCENELLVQEAFENEYGKFLKFETLTMCPFDLNLIDTKYLDDKTLKALNNYHKRVYDNLSPYLNDEEKIFLRKATRVIK